MKHEPASRPLAQWAPPAVLILGLGLSALVGGFIGTRPEPLAAGGAVFGALALISLAMAAFVQILGTAALDAARRAEEAAAQARESELRFRDLAELSSDWFWEQDADFRFTAMSGGVYEKGRFRGESTLGKARWELPILGIGEAQWREHRALLERHEPFHDLVYRIDVGNGDIHWFSVSGRPVFGSDGQFTGYRGTGRDITAIKRADAALRESEERYRYLFELSPDAVFVHQRRTIILANAAAARLFHAADAQALVGRDLRDLVAPEDWPATERRIASLEEGRESFLPPAERLYLSVAGQRTPAESVAARIVMNNEPAVLSVSRDITERKRMEMQLRLAATVFETSREGVAITDAQRNIVSVNPAFTQITGYTSEEVLGRNPRMLSSGRHDAAFYQAMWASIAADGYWSGEIWNKRKNGEAYPEWLSITTVRDANGAPLHYIGIFTDITESKRAGQALRESEQRYRALFDMAPDAVFAHQDCIIVLANAAAAQLFAAPSAEALIGHSIRELVAAADWDFVDQRRSRLEAFAGSPATPAAMRWRTFDGREILVESSGARILLGRTPAVLTVARDVTEQRRSELEIQRLNERLEHRVRERTAELLASNKELEAFSYSVSHDLRAPLRGIDGFAQILAEDYGARLDQDGLGYLARIRQASQHMAALIDDMLELARITRATIRRREVDLSALVEAIVLELRDGSGRQAEFVIAEHVTAQADPILIGVVLENLLRNAWKFTGRRNGARIEFGEAGLNGERAFFVRDNGAGFDPAYAGKLFRAFQRLHHVKDYPGTGIGLATVQRVIERHGGRVWAEGSVGQGATFYFTIG